MTTDTAARTPLTDAKVTRLGAGCHTVGEFVPADFARSLEAQLEAARALLQEGADGFGKVLIATSDDKAVRNWRKRCREFLVPTGDG